jgi:hypothetical protein
MLIAKAYLCPVLVVITLTGSRSYSWFNGDDKDRPQTFSSERGSDRREAKTADLWNRAISLISLEKFSDADATLLALVENAPDFFPPWDTPPKIITPFSKARHRFFSANRRNFQVNLIDAQATPKGLNLILQGTSALSSLVTKITLHLRTKEQSYFRSMSFPSTFNEENRLHLNLAIFFKPLTHVDYYVEFIGNYHAPFQTLGSFMEPLSLKVSDDKVDQITDNGAKSLTLLELLKTNWPILLGTTVTIIGVLTYGLLSP